MVSALANRYGIDWRDPAKNTNPRRTMSHLKIRVECVASTGDQNRQPVIDTEYPLVLVSGGRTS
jgi:hypothetical protein